MRNCIYIRKKYLIFRDQAKTLAQLIHKKLKKENLKTIFLDFSYVDFASRSFIDEFLNRLNGLEKENIRVQIIHLKPELLKFIAIVQKTKSKIKKELSKQFSK